MSELTDKELNAIRLSVIDLIKSFFMDEPGEKKVITWREFISTLSSEKINPTMDSAVRKLDDMLANLKLDDLKNEYYELFTDPFSAHIVHTTLSYYADGHDFGQSLVDLRRFLLKSGVTRAEGLDESEDSLVFLLDILSTLIHDEENDIKEARNKQSELLKDFLNPFSAFFTSALAKNERANFYEACAAFFAGYVDLEKGLMVDI